MSWTANGFLSVILLDNLRLHKREVGYIAVVGWPRLCIEGAKPFIAFTAATTGAAAGRAGAELLTGIDGVSSRPVRKIVLLSGAERAADGVMVNFQGNRAADIKRKATVWLAETQSSFR